jgi:hypothetical protein
MDWSLREVRVKPDISEDDAEELLRHIYRLRAGDGIALFQGYLFRLLNDIGGAVDYVAFTVPSGTSWFKVSVYSNGTLYVNADEPMMPTIDAVVSEVAKYRPGYNHA